MGTISYLYGLLCLVALLGHWRIDRHLLVEDLKSSPIAHLLPSFFDQRTGSEQKAWISDRKTNHLLKIAQSQIGVREATGNNDGHAVEAYLHYTGNRKGDPWCASFVSWVFGKAGLPQPRSAWSPALFPKQRLLAKAVPAAVFGIYFPDKGRIAHTGLVERQKGHWIYTIEGNTNFAGSREGDGVYRKLRHLKTIKAYANWLAKREGEAQ